MKQTLLLATILVLSPCLAQADSVAVTDQNSSIKVTRDDPGSTIPGVLSNPVRFPRTIEWTVEGRRILVYPAGAAAFLDISHFHSDSHVTANQIHAQGPVFGYGTSDAKGTVTGGVVYTVDGGTSGSGMSRISEKVDMVNNTGGDVSVSAFLTGMGWKPDGTGHTAGLEVPDLTGLNITGTTAVFIQGNDKAVSITDPDPSTGMFAPVKVLPFVSFSGFNPVSSQALTLPNRGTLTMITELKVAPAKSDEQLGDHEHEKGRGGSGVVHGFPFGKTVPKER